MAEAESLRDLSPSGGRFGVPRGKTALMDVSLPASGSLAGKLWLPSGQQREVNVSKRGNTKGRQSQSRASSASRKDKDAPARTAGGEEPQAVSAAETSAGRTGVESGIGPSHQHIAARAYELWQAQGRPEGNDLANWYEAERQLRTATR
jgi:hypothetical protein